MRRPRFERLGDRSLLRFTPFSNFLVAAAVATVAGITAMISSASAAYITVYGGPTFAPPEGVGYAFGVAAVNDAGTAVGTVGEGDGTGGYEGGSARAYRWSALGGPAVELTGLDRYTSVFAINNAGTAVGSSLYSPLRWEAMSTAATELQAFWSASRAVDINDSGTAVGHSGEGVGVGVDEVGVDRATLWNASGVARTLLSHPDGYLGHSYATAINSSGTVIGWGDLGGARWNASGGPVEVLNIDPVAINDAGTIVGNIGTPNGQRAARVDPSGTTATALDGLGFSAAGAPYSHSYALDVNTAGTAAGFASTPNGERAVRWDAGGVTATELGTLSQFDGLYAVYIARDINDAGAIVGHAYLVSPGDYVYPGPEPNDPWAWEARAVLWTLDGVAVDLNTLIDPQSGWTLNVAQALSETGWIVGRGTFDPDGNGGQPASGRLFLMQVPATVPESSADFNNDGSIDGADLLKWQGDFGQNALSDADNDGDSDGADFLAWQRQLGGTPAVAAHAAVPEPAAAALALVGVSSILLVRRRWLRRPNFRAANSAARTANLTNLAIGACSQRSPIWGTE